MEPKFNIGTQFKRRHSKHGTETVTDILTTINSAGETVKISYVATHEFCGQTVTDRDVCQTTIAMGQLI